MSVVLTQYDNYTVTGTTTVQDDVATLNVSTISEVMSLASGILDVGLGNNDYPGLGGGVILANGTDGTITGGGSTSIPYPTPYLKIDGFNLYGPPSSGSCEMTPPLNPLYAASTMITLSDYYYSAITPAKFISGNFDVDNIVQFDNSSFSNFLASDTALMKAYPELKTCIYEPVGFGPPAVKMSVSALTASTTATVKGSYAATTQSPQPASSITHSAPASTTTRPVPLSNTVMSPEVSSQPSTNIVQQTPITTPESSQDEKPSNQASQQVPAVNQDSTSGENAPGSSPQPNPEATSGYAGGVETIDLPQQGTPTQTLENPAQGLSSAAPAISFHGSTIQADPSSHYDLPGIGTIRPGGEPVTTNNVVYSLPPSATAIISNGNTIPLTPVLGSDESVGQNPVLTFAGSAYSLDSSSNLVIAGQTLRPGSEAITVSDTPVSLAPGASIAVIGSSTQSLTSPVRTKAPVITHGGSTYTASSSAFTIDGQRLTPGGQITVSGTPISLASDASVAVIGSSTQSLQYAITTTNPLGQDHVLSFDGSTITADSSSAFVIAGEILTPGGEITVSGTPISLGSGGNVAVVGSRTQQLALPTPTDQGRILTFAGSTFTADGSSIFTIAGQTLSPGGAITVSGTPISLVPGASIAVVGSSTQQLGSPTPTDQGRLLTFAGSTFTADSSVFTIAGQTLSPGGVITVSGTPISLGPSATIAAIGRSTQILAFTKEPEPSKVLTFGGSTYTADTNSYFVIAGQTLTPSGAITISGTPISLAPSATVAVIGSSTQTLASTAGTETPKVLTFRGSSYTADTNSDFVIAGQTLTPGGVITVSGTPISLGSSATVALVGSSTETLLQGPASTKLITFGASTYTADAASDFIIAGQTLTPGGAITISGTPISLDSSATIAIIGTSTETLASEQGTKAITFGGSTYTADAASDFILAGQTLTPGGVITVSGTPISYASSGSDIVVGGTTESVLGYTSSIVTGFGPAETGGAGNGSAPFLGVAGAKFTVPRGFMLLGFFGVGWLLAGWV